MASRMDVLTVEEGKDGKSFWYRVGVAFEAKHGDGWDVKLAALPVNGKLFLRAPKPKGEPQREPESNDARGGGW